MKEKERERERHIFKNINRDSLTRLIIINSACCSCMSSSGTYPIIYLM